jgi:YebC/PmpR family DNA-binding regulatory protein
MAGHSKWANIKHSKARVDAKRGKVFTKLIREITVAARMGGGDADANPRLRLAVDKSLGQNMPKDTIQRAITRGAGGGDSDNMVEMRYEGYGPNGVAIMVDCLTDNKNRTVGEVRHAFSKCGGNLGTDGSVAYLFTKTGLISFAPGVEEDTIMEAALEAGADDIKTNSDGSIDVVTSEDLFEAVRDALKAENLEFAQAEITMLASLEVEITTEEEAQKMIRLTDMLEDLDDVQNVYSNATIPDDILNAMS